MTTILSFNELSDRDLLTEVSRLASHEREATARLVASLAEVDARRLYLGGGCSSLFTYCTQELHLSEHAAYNRIEAARAARRFPLILERLAEGSIHLTAIRLLAPAFTPENHRTLLNAARQFIVCITLEVDSSGTNCLQWARRIKCHRLVAGLDGRMMMTRTLKHLETKAVHAGVPSPRTGGAVVMPIFQSAMFECTGEGSYHELKYLRLNNTPTQTALHGKLAALEGAEAAVATSSGMAAISTALLTVLAPGDHLLAQECLYGGTHDLLTTELKHLGICVDFIDADDPSSWPRLLRPTTRAIYVETISNPLMRVPDLDGIVDFARSHRLVSLIDNTFATPVNFRPLERGFDLVLHSCTKYLNGHSDIVAGAVIGSNAWIERITHRLNHLGGSLDPHACFLLDRGLKTLVLRVRHQCASALAISRALEAHSSVERVNYPGLPNHPQHARARSLFEGASGMLSFELKGGAAAADSFMRRVTLPIVAPSLGGAETLLTRPAVTSHAGMAPADRLKTGITDGLIRMSVGLEACDEILDDLVQALDASK